MQVSIDKHFAKVLRQPVKSGLYQNASEAVRDAIRHAFCGHDDSDDTDLVAEKLRESKDSPAAPWKKEEALALVAKHAVIRKAREKRSDSNDTPMLAEKIREARNSPRSPYSPGEFSGRMKVKITNRRKKAS